MSSVDFVEYVYLLKLVRGVLLAKSAVGDDVKNWLRRAIRWRPVGVGGRTRKVLRRSGFSSKSVLSLVYAFQSHRDISSLLEGARLCGELAEALVLSSTYVVPLVILDIEAFDELVRRRLIVSSVRSDVRVKDRMVKLHLRISEYSMKDNFYDLIMRARDAIIGGRLDAELQHRKNFCERDLKRYWRINRGKGRPVVVYIDPLRALRKKVDDLKEILSASREAALGLGICVGVVIPNMLTGEEKKVSNG